MHCSRFGLHHACHRPGTWSSDRAGRTSTGRIRTGIIFGIFGPIERRGLNDKMTICGFATEHTPAYATLLSSDIYWKEISPDWDLWVVISASGSCLKLRGGHILSGEISSSIRNNTLCSGCPPAIPEWPVVVSMYEISSHKPRWPCRSDRCRYYPRLFLGTDGKSVGFLRALRRSRSLLAISAFRFRSSRFW